ncbi:hypothetical protein LACWKB10_1862 [Lactobacillus sp. wkB10]|nr:hypothetical protein LACWKB10_1862 [Lactobacillus sp. wkB10]
MSLHIFTLLKLNDKSNYMLWGTKLKDDDLKIKKSFLKALRNTCQFRL